MDQWFCQFQKDKDIIETTISSKHEKGILTFIFRDPRNPQENHLDLFLDSSLDEHLFYLYHLIGGLGNNMINEKDPLFEEFHFKRMIVDQDKRYNHQYQEKLKSILDILTHNSCPERNYFFNLNPDPFNKTYESFGITCQIRVKEMKDICYAFPQDKVILSYEAHTENMVMKDLPITKEKIPDYPYKK